MVIFVHRGGIGLQGGHQGVADLVVGHNALFRVGENGVLLLVACDDHLNALLQIRLGGKSTAIPNRPESSLVDDVGKLCTGGAGGHPGDVVEVHIVGNLNLLGVNLENFLPALEIRQFHRYPAVKTAGTQQGRDPENRDGWWRPESPRRCYPQSRPSR